MIHEQYTTNLFRRPPAIWDFAPSRSPFLSGSGRPAASKDEEAGLRPGPQSPRSAAPGGSGFPAARKRGEIRPLQGPGEPERLLPGTAWQEPRSAGTRRQLTSCCPSGMLLNEWAASQRIRTIPLHGNMGVTGDFRFETLSDAKKKKTIFIACDAEILKYCTFRTTVPLLIFTVPPA